MSLQIALADNFLLIIYNMLIMYQNILLFQVLTFIL
jgi:hypothetical protein